MRIRKEVTGLILMIQCILSLNLGCVEKDRINRISNVQSNAHEFPVDGGDKNGHFHNSINIGLLLPFKTMPQYAKELILSAEMAVEEINSLGGVLGKNLMIISADDGRNTEGGTAASLLLTEYNTKLFVGPTSSSRLIETVKLMSDENVMFISPSVTATEISTLEDNNRVFRTAGSDEMQSKVAAKFVTKNMGKKTASIYYIDNEYGEGLKNEFKSSFEKLGGEILAEDFYNPSLTHENLDFDRKIRYLLKESPELLYIISYSNDIKLMAKALGENPKMKSGEVMLMSAESGIGKYSLDDLSLLEGMYGTSHSASDMGDFNKKFISKFNQRPTRVETADIYDIIYLYAIGLLTAADENPAKIAPLMRDITNGGEIVSAADFKKIPEMIDRRKNFDFKGISQDLDFDKHGDVKSRDFIVWKLTDGKFRTVVPPSEI